MTDDAPDPAFGAALGPVLLVAGPPASAAIFAKVVERLEPVPVVAIDLVGDAPPKALLQAAIAELRPTVVLAHGLAVPLLLRVDVLGATRVVSNGPITRLDPITARLAQMPQRLLAATLLRPEVLHRWLSSSLGLRRAVANPYAMDRDTVVTLTRALVGTPERRTQTAAWIRSLPGIVREPVLPEGACAIWGDQDPLYPVSEARALVGADDERLLLIPGARHMHPHERPWELADALATWIDGAAVPAPPR